MGSRDRVSAHVHHRYNRRPTDQWTMACCSGAGNGKSRTDFGAGWADSGYEQWPGGIALRRTCSCVPCLHDRAWFHRVRGLQIFAGAKPTSTLSRKLFIIGFLLGVIAFVVANVLSFRKATAPCCDFPASFGFPFVLGRTGGFAGGTNPILSGFVVDAGAAIVACVAVAWLFARLFPPTLNLFRRVGQWHVRTSLIMLVRTNKSSRAAGACFSTNFVRRRVL